MIALNFEFVNPELFWLLLLVPAAGVWYYLKRDKQTASLRMSSLDGFKASGNLLGKLKPLLFVLRIIALVILITAMARPRTYSENSRTKTTKGIDMELVSRYP